MRLIPTEAVSRNHQTRNFERWPAAYGGRQRAPSASKRMANIPTTSLTLTTQRPSSTAVWIDVSALPTTISPTHFRKRITILEESIRTLLFPTDGGCITERSVRDRKR